MRKSAQQNPNSSRRASVLLLVLVVVAMLTLAGTMFVKLMSSEHRAVVVHGQKLKAQALTDSGIRFVETYLAQTIEQIEEDGGFYDNPARFRGMLVTDGEQPKMRGRFSVLAPGMLEGVSSGFRYGLEDESTRINLNALMAVEASTENGGRDLLMALPGMSEEIADAILDWIDDDDDPREFGAELDHYSGVIPPYAPKNGSLDTVEELLLVRGVTPELLFGPDANRNGMVDGNELGGSVGEFDNSDGTLDRGWSAYFTLHSAEKNARLDGTPKIDVNSEDLEQLHADLVEALGDEDMANYIIAYRQYGPAPGNSNASASSSMAAGAFDPDFDTEAKVPLSTILDLIGDSGVMVPQEPGGGQSSNSGGRGGPAAGQTVQLRSPFPNGPFAMATYLPKLMENLSVNPDATIPGRINVNQCSRVVLLGIPGLDEELVNDIMANRIEEMAESDDETQRYETWLLTEGIVTLDEMKALMPFVTAQGHVFRAQIVGFTDAPGPTVRIEALIDATTESPRLLFWRDMSHLGRGYSYESLGAEIAIE